MRKRATKPKNSRHIIPRGLVVTAIFGVAAIAALAWWLTSHLRSKAPPEVPLTALEARAAETIRRQMEAVRQSPRAGAQWGKLGTMLKSHGFRAQASTCLAEAERLDPKQARWPYLQATLLNREATPLAITKLRRAIALCGNEPEAPRLRLAQLLAETGRGDEAQRELRELLAANPGCAPARLMLAHITHQQGASADAAAMATSCTTNPYTARAAWTLLAALHRRQGDTNAAQLATRRAAAVSADVAWPDPFEDEVSAWRDDPRSLSDRAQAFLLAGRPADALPLIRRLAEGYPDFAETWLLLGRAQYLQKQPVPAERSLRRFLEVDPQSVNGHFQLGMCLLAQNRFAEAAATFERATALKNDFGPAFLNLGFALVRSGKKRDAIPAFEQAIRHSPEIIDAYVLLADLHLQLGNKTNALAIADLAERLDSSDRRLPALRDKLRQAGPLP